MATIGAVDFWEGFAPNEDPLFSRYLISSYAMELADIPDLLLHSVYGENAEFPFFYGQFSQSIAKEKYSRSTKLFYSAEPYHLMHPSVLTSLDNGHFAISMLKSRHPNHLWLSNVQRTAFYGVEDPLKFYKIFMPLEERRFATYIYSNRVPYREYLCSKLSEYRPVDCPGRSLNNMHAPQLMPREKFSIRSEFSSSIIKFASNYKFFLSFENSVSPGYCTEKIWWAFWSGCIPVYYGAPDVCEIFNPKSFINVSSFSSIDDCIRHVIEVDKNNDLYQSYFEQPALLRPDLFSNSRVQKFFRRVMYGVRFRKRQTYILRLMGFDKSLIG